MIPEYTQVIGVDSKHLQQLEMVLPTWAKHKPNLLEHPWLVFYDYTDMSQDDVTRMRALLNKIDVQYAPWPPQGVVYTSTDDSKWQKPQRVKMLPGFVHMSKYVETPYWLKIDVDTTATGHADWIDPSWFTDLPAIISHPWGFTKPPEQMLYLDQWAADNANDLPMLVENEPLQLAPDEGSARLSHKRIISWCGFFNTEFTRMCADMAEKICGQGKLPVPSQDGYMWYVAKRCGHGIQRVNMKSRGWVHKSTMHGIRQAAAEAML